MAQAESRMTVAKAIALWKANSGVCGIEGQLEAQHKTVSLARMAENISKHIHFQKLLGVMAMQEHHASLTKKK
jgi:hypothetical protein